MNGDRDVGMGWLARAIYFRWDGVFDRERIKGWEKVRRRRQRRRMSKDRLREEARGV